MSRVVQNGCDRSFDVESGESVESGDGGTLSCWKYGSGKVIGG